MEKVVKVLQSPPQRQQEPAPQKTTQIDDEFQMPDNNTLETLPRSQFAALMEQKLLASLKKSILGPLQDEIGGLKKGLNSQQITKMIENTKSKYQDFDDYMEKMTELSKTRPGLTPDDLYHLAKAQTPPEEVAKINGKYKAADGPKLNEFTFGGIMPSNGGDGAQSRRMEPRAAADDAWDKTVAEMGGAPAFTE